MKVYIVFKDVPFEFGQIYDVFDSYEKAEEYKKQVEEEDIVKRDYYEIQEWEVL